MILINFAVSKEKNQLYWACIVSFVAYFTMQFKLNIESCEEADEKEMFPENKIINALKRNRGSINPFTTFKQSG